jgi:putative addiction module component (TIGR02574 family)
VANTDEHLRELLKLPLEGRAHAAAVLLESLDGDAADPGAEGAWAVEIERRLALIDAGQAKLVPLEDAASRLRRAARAR